jgi:hypothetical protein
MRLDKINHWTAAGLLLMLVSVPAWAFQESKIAPADKPAAQAPLTPQVQIPDIKPGVQLSVPEAAGDGKGTEIRLPGMGKLGVLPKLNFGLDVLYGANEDRRTLPNQGQKEEELTVRGSIKHKF